MEEEKKEIKQKVPVKKEPEVKTDAERIKASLEDETRLAEHVDQINKRTPKSSAIR